jgi:hypothetical protein
VRRLKERLGIEPGEDKFRAIATSASIPNIPGADADLLKFTSNLFGEPAKRFSLVRLENTSKKLRQRTSSTTAMAAFARFHDEFTVQAPSLAIDRLAEGLGLGHVDHPNDPQMAIYDLLEHSEDVTWLRERTARNATLLTDVSKELWPGAMSEDEQERATAGRLSAGSFARAQPITRHPTVAIHAHTCLLSWY